MKARSFSSSSFLISSGLDFSETESATLSSNALTVGILPSISSAFILVAPSFASSASFSSLVWMNRLSRSASLMAVFFCSSRSWLMRAAILFLERNSISGWIFCSP